MSSSENYSTFFIIILIMIIFSNSNNKDKNTYQVAQYGKDKAIVLNTVTGEAWATKELTTPYGDHLPQIWLEPIDYCIQDENSLYKTNESRNSKNKDSDWLSDWWEKIKKSFSKKSI